MPHGSLQTSFTLATKILVDSFICLELAIFLVLVFSSLLRPEMAVSIFVGNFNKRVTRSFS